MYLFGVIGVLSPGLYALEKLYRDMKNKKIRYYWSYNMSKSNKQVVFVILSCTLIISILPIKVFANSAEPPSLVILVNNPPEDLSIIMISNENQPEARVRKVAWEGYYAFYSRNMQGIDKYSFRVTTKGKSFECSMSEPLKKYNNVFTLNLSNQTLKPGKYSYRSAILVSIRLFLTLFIEGIIFTLFQFRQRKSWLAFLGMNIFTQGALNLWLNSGSSIMPNYLIFSLIFGEIFVFAIEMIGLPILIDEYKKRVVLFAFVANLISLYVGGYLISVLPV